MCRLFCRKFGARPARGNYESFLGAIHAGADAVYLGGSKFGARAYANNFTDEEITRFYMFLNNDSLLAGALLITVTAVITTAIIRRYRRTEEEKEAEDGETSEKSE